MTSFTKNRILRDRYKLFSSLGRWAKRNDRDEVWFFGAGDCRRILAGKKFTAKRGGASEKARANGSESLAKFYDDWLMFREDRTHLIMKRIATKAIFARLKELRSSIPTYGVSYMVGSDFLSNFSEKYVVRAFATFFDIDEVELTRILQATTPAIDILGLENICIDSLNEAETKLQECYSILKELRERKNFVATLSDAMIGQVQPITAMNVIINLVADGIHPTVSALCSEVYLRSKVDKYNEDDRLTGFRFYEEAPFQYIARRATENCEIGGRQIRADDRVIACIAQCSRMGEQDLTFGYGRHGCPGRMLAETIIREGVNSAEHHIGEYDDIEIDVEWAASIGYRVPIEMIIRKKND